VQDAIEARVAQTGASVIIVDDGIDSGPIIAQERIEIAPGDTEHSLHDRIKLVERQLLVSTILDVANGHIDLQELSRA
jgi:phosphoribosylglycinamide formyltransferase-1